MLIAVVAEGGGSTDRGRVAYERGGNSPTGATSVLLDLSEPHGLGQDRAKCPDTPQGLHLSLLVGGFVALDVAQVTNDRLPLEPKATKIAINAH